MHGCTQVNYHLRPLDSARVCRQFFQRDDVPAVFTSWVMLLTAMMDDINAMAIPHTRHLQSILSAACVMVSQLLHHALVDKSGWALASIARFRIMRIHCQVWLSSVSM